MAKKPTSRAKSTVKKRTVNASKPVKTAKKQAGAPFQEQDPKRRLGNFQTTGEHARQGGRARGIVGADKPRKYTRKKKAAE